MDIEPSQTEATNPQEANHLAQFADLIGADAYRERDESYRAEPGQFFTPPMVARFMASMFGPVEREARVFDAGAGVGSLTAALGPV